MPNLLNVAVPVAGTYTTSPMQIRQGPNSQGDAMAVAAQCNFTYGSGGTSISVNVQTSFDGGQTWCDAITFALLLASLRQVGAVSSTTSMATPVTVTDGSTSAAVVAGMVGSWWRVKYVPVGAYAGSTLRVDVSPIMVPAGAGAFN